MPGGRESVAEGKFGLLQGRERVFEKRALLHLPYLLGHRRSAASASLAGLTVNLMLSGSGLKIPKLRFAARLSALSDRAMKIFLAHRTRFAVVRVNENAVRKFLLGGTRLLGRWRNFSGVNMKPLTVATVLAFCIGLGLLFSGSGVDAETIAASSIPAADLLKPADLAATLQSSAMRPLILQVGFRKLFDEAHIVNAEYAGPSGEGAGLAVLRSRVAGLSKDTAIVIYCGCCPWGHCPNIGAAFSTLRGLGFHNVKVLYIADNFGTDWIEKGYPVTKGG
jgi:hypothetical protein